MKLLIKIFLDTLNSYDVIQILDAISLSITDKDNTKICFISNDLSFDFSPYEALYLVEISTPKMINYKLSELDWDLVIPIHNPCIISKNFDNVIRKIYNQNFPNLDGVLWLNDGIQKEINKFPIIGRKYFDKFNYVYNPAYQRKNYEEEFTEVMKIVNKYYFVETVLFKNISIKSDDDNIYEMRKKLNFCL